MSDADSPDFPASLVVGARLLAGWACVAVAVLDLAMGIGGDRTYLIFHLLLLVGGGSLIFFDQLPRRPRRRFPYAVLAAAALAVTMLTALPRTSGVCCMPGLTVQHGYPLTLLGWNVGRPHHLAPAHVVADFVFWYLAGMVLLFAGAAVRPARSVPAGRASTHAEERAMPEAPAVLEPPAHHDEAQAADDESVGGLP
jgi:hypothetical protein